QINLADRHRPSRWSKKPLSDQFWLGEGVEDQLARSFELSRHNDLSLAACGQFQFPGVLHQISSSESPVNVSSVLSSFQPARHRDAEICPPKTGGNVPTIPL